MIDDSTLWADKAAPLVVILKALTTNACQYVFPYVVAKARHPYWVPVASKKR